MCVQFSCMPYIVGYACGMIHKLPQKIAYFVENWKAIQLPLIISAKGNPFFILISKTEKFNFYFHFRKITFYEWCLDKQYIDFEWEHVSDFTE